MKFTETLRKGALVVGAIILLATPSIFAEETPQTLSTGITISPTSVDEEISAGKNYSGKVMVINQGKVGYKYKVYATPYSVNGEDYSPAFTPIPGARDVTKWFTLKGNTDGYLKPDAQENISYTVDVPNDTPAGSYTAVIFAETSNDVSGGAGVVTKKRVGTIFYINVPGQADKRGSIASWSVKVLQNAPLTMTYRLANEGSLSYRANVKISVSDMFGNKKFVSDRNPAVVPQKIRKEEIKWENGGTFGLFKVNGEVKIYDQTHALPTKYVLVASASMRIAVFGLLLLFLVSLVVVIKNLVRRDKKN